MPTRKTITSNDLLTRAVTEVVPRELAQAKLASSKKLRVYLGIDPTGVKLHLGHAIPLRKLRDFQEAGHETILVIGSFTAMIGDPSGQDKQREPLTEAQVKKNFASYKQQAKLVLDLDKVKVRFNHEWLGKLKPKDIIALMSQFTAQQLLERDMFRERQRRQLPIAAHELIYPLLVGYDSVVLDVDAEIGGNDQLFNMLCGRTLQQAYKKRDKFVLTTKILEGTDGRKMSKTYHNAIYLTDEPGEMYGKVMSIKDELIVPYFELTTNAPMSKVKEIEAGLKKNDNPKQHKSRLAREIVTIYHGVKAATKAAVEFNRVHRDKAMPAEVPTVKIPAGKKSLAITDLLVLTKLAPSKAQARRLVEQGGVKIGGEIIKDWRAAVAVKTGLVIQVGPRKFVRLE